MEHSPAFLKLVEEARPRVQEIVPSDVRQKLKENPSAVLLDVREDHEWEKGHIREARHLGRGILERDLEARIPDKTTELLIYCGGGYRSVLAADAAQRLGYEHVFSIQGGYKAMVREDWPVETGAQPSE